MKTTRQLDQPLPSELSSGPFIPQYDLLRERLRELSASGVPNRAAIDAVIAQLDKAHAELKAHHSCASDAPPFTDTKDGRPRRRPGMAA